MLLTCAFSCLNVQGPCSHDIFKLKKDNLNNLYPVVVALTVNGEKKNTLDYMVISIYCKIHKNKMSACPICSCET